MTLRNLDWKNVERLATTNTLYTFRDAELIANTISNEVLKVIDRHDGSGKDADTVKNAIRAERKDRPVGTKAVVAGHRVAESILRGALLRSEPLTRFTGIRTDLQLMALLGAHERYSDAIIEAMRGTNEARWALALLSRTRDVVFDGKDRGPITPELIRV